MYLKKNYNLLIGELTAEEIKIKLGSAFPLDKEISYSIKGRDLVAGVPKKSETVVGAGSGSPFGNAR